MTIIRLSIFYLGSVDAVAAQCILERYLEEEGRHAIDAVPCPYPPPDEIATFDYDLIRTYVKMKNNVEDDDDWHRVKAYVDNYKVRWLIVLKTYLERLYSLHCFYLLGLYSRIKWQR